MKRFLTALLVGGVLFAAVFGAAASLGVSGGTIQAGSDTDLVCDEDGVRVAGWGLETDDGKVYMVRIHDIDETCADSDANEEEIFVNVTKNGVTIAKGKAKMPLDATTGDNDPDANQIGVKVSLSPAVLAADITDITVFIEGDAND